MNKEEIGNLIKKGRKEKGLTQQELATRLFVTDKAVSNWETGKNIPDNEIITKIEKVLDIDLQNKIISSKEKYFKTLKKIVASLSLLLMIILLVYTISNYNRINIYSLNIVDNISGYDMDNSFITVDNKNIILSLNKIVNYEFPYQPDYKIVLYTNDKIIYENNNFKGTNELLDLTLTQKELRNLYIDIYYQAYDNKVKKDTIKINTKRIISNGNLIYKSNAKSTNINYNNRTISFLRNNGYKQVSKYVYDKSYDYGHYLYNIKYNVLYYDYKKDDIEYYAVKGEYINNYLIKKDNKTVAFKTKNSTNNIDKYEEFINQRMEEYKKLID